ncbi:type II secretion system F family protein [Actinobacillus suis]|uniref:Pili/fimbriae biogenesis protein n=2 Tax=Actinobacillus suis TaxID=716 RepID=K0GBS3_ACTSU|nr:type II secretion system F family protein [Actinobacillus suis]AFU19145.1 pili/fimbriae biogenesis protein [Actinobacillus suis H91-0380]AIJ31285.1 pili/fimbriae biogenesis protein [Actinobacillus suis ATCC 33415]MCO4166682.1 type II secretion system F family protein [Actinobacillus suis]MCO4168018.1 type II secretion system F family protein [Actinobacillus suis]MCQ9629441.1 type II secretion system F family protein [Actinobacillus suis]
MVSIFEFHWKAKNRFQQKQSGILLAQNHAEAEQKLLAKGYQYIHIQRNFTFSRQPKADEVTQFLAQLALLINASIPFKQALMMQQENCTNIKLYQWLLALNASISSGYSFSASLAKLDLYLSKQEIQLIRMGEQSGKLSVVLENIAKTRNQADKLAKKVRKITFYPLIVLVISCVLTLGLLVFIVPQFADLYMGKAQNLPWLTSLLFSLSAFLRQNGIFLCCGSIVVMGVLLCFAKKFGNLTACQMRLLSYIPFFNQVIRYTRIIFFTQNLALMLSAHLHLEVALKAFLAEKMHDRLLQEQVRLTLSLLQQGYKFSEGLNPAVFTPQMVQMITIGEKSANLAVMCTQISDIYQLKLDYQIDLLSQLLEPILMLLMGIIIGTVLIGLYLPIFDLGILV